ncbi:MAG: twin-arginine translocase TatA/TatE family subunit [Deltaproteobacteria bacterium]|nr:twin-arginine translocase TatA/TatE family subunit [Deltaproteobacteria bacterium]
MPNIGIWELILIVVIILLLFGANKLPAIGTALGKAIKDFKKAASGEEERGNAKPADKSEEKKN